MTRSPPARCRISFRDARHRRQFRRRPRSYWSRTPPVRARTLRRAIQSAAPTQPLPRRSRRPFGIRRRRHLEPVPLPCVRLAPRGNQLAQLGEARQAKRAMNWFYAALVLLAVNLFAPKIPEMFLIITFVNLILLLAWNFLECEQQRRLLKRLFGNRYERRGLFLPIVAAIGCMFLYSVLGGIVAVIFAR